MPDRSFKIVDPVYDLVVFDEPITPRRALSDHPASSHGKWPRSGRYPGLLSSTLRHNFGAVIRSREFQRLHHLRQMGLAWLVFPSGTQTRFSHSIGVYALGEMALARASIIPPGGRSATPLWTWAHKKDLDEEFLLALLLHDIGHFPFSHLLEVIYPEVSHEELSGALILSEYIEDSPFFAKYMMYLEATGVAVRSAQDRLESGVLGAILKERFSKVSKWVVAWLISGHSETQHFTGITTERVERGIREDAKAGLHSGTMGDLRVLKLLVSGLLDLDRFDHYQRDSFFTGFKIANFNFRNFVNGVTLQVPRRNLEPIVHLSRDAAAQAVAMLEGREIITRYLFQNPAAVAYQLMFRWAARMHAEGQMGSAEGGDRLVWLFYTDDEILSVLRHSKVRSVRIMLDMILTSRPFQPSKKGLVELNVDLETPKDLDDRLGRIARLAKVAGSGHVLPAVLWELPKIVQDIDPDPGGQWLDLSRVRVEGEEFVRGDVETFDYLTRIRRRGRRLTSFYVDPKQEEIPLQFWRGVDSLMHWAG